MLLAPAIVAVVGLTLAGCSNDDAGDSVGDSNSPSSTSAPEQSTGPSRDSADANKGAETKDSQTKKSGKTDSGGSKQAAPPAKDSSVKRCTASHLTGSIQREPGGGSAGHMGVYLVVKNTGKSPCLMKGYGGLSFVGDSNGTQLGAAADRTKARVPSVVVLPNGHSRAPVQIADAGNYGSNCDKATADGFRFYPPNETHSIFVKKSVATCKNSKLHLLQMKPFQPMS